MRTGSIAFALCCLVFATPVSGEGGDPQPLRKSHENVIYGMHGGAALLMDVYQPQTSNGHAVLYMPGCGWHSPPEYGGFSLKDLQDVSHLSPMLERGLTVFVINYRTAPLFRYPAPIEDARRAVRFIRHHGQRFGATSGRVASAGHSSGGHLALMIAVEPEEGEAEAADPVERRSAAVQAAVSLAGPADFNSQDWSAWTTGVLADFIGRMPNHPNFPIFGSPLFREASPIAHVDPSDPAVLLIYGNADETVPVTQGRSMHEKLRGANVDVRYIEVPGAGHRVNEIFAAGGSAEATITPDAVAEWIVSKLEGDE